METKFNEKESLALISEMIELARNNFQKGSGNSMIFWGWFVALTAIMNVVLALVLENPYYSFNIWWIMILGQIVDSFIIRKKDVESAIVKTHIDRIIAAIWRGFLISIIVLLIVIFGFAYGTQNPKIFILINPCIMIMIGLSEFITAKTCRFKPYFYGAIIMWIGAVSCFIISLITSNIVIYQFLILAVCMIVGFVIPGYSLNKLSKKDV